MTLRAHIRSCRWTLNIPVKDSRNAREISNLGVPAIASIVVKEYESTASAAREVREMLHLSGLFTSVALGDGDPRQWSRVLEVALEARPPHINQLYPTAGRVVGALRASGADTMVNALVQPAGQGYISLSTGLLSSGGEKAVVPLRAGLLLLKDAGIESVKYYPMHGLDALDEFKALVKLAAEEGIGLIEPSGGIDASNVGKIIEAGLEAGDGRVHIAPHVYGAVRSKEDRVTLADKVSEVHVAAMEWAGR